MDMRVNVVEEDRGGTPAFQHLQDANKSILTLQELQNEVGALLEFRDVVIETFPQLKGKLRSNVGTNTAGVAGKWEPGVRVRRKVKEDPPRSRSNSRSKGSVVVQDSGFCTAESSNSKKTMEDEEFDELWCLLELIQTKGTKLRNEAESMKSMNRSRSLPQIENPELDVLLREKDQLLFRIGELEAENLARAVEYESMSRKVTDLIEEKKRLENLPSDSPIGDLGRLDQVLSSSPCDVIHCPPGLTPDREVTAAILKEKNVLELQRHLITTTHQNQVVQRKLEKLSKVRTALTAQLEKFKEENEDLRFQLEEKSIELEGTRARVRLLEKQNPPVENSSRVSVELSDHTAEDNSSTESAHTTPSRRKQKPSRIPKIAKSSPSAPPNSLIKPKTLSTPRSIPTKPRQESPNANEGKLYNKFAAFGNWLKISSPSP